MALTFKELDLDKELVEAIEKESIDKEILEFQSGIKDILMDWKKDKIDDESASKLIAEKVYQIVKKSMDNFANY